MRLRSRHVGTAVVAVLISTTAAGPTAQIKTTQPATMRITADPLTNWGSTFHALEQKAGRVTTRFGDGHAVAERGVDGQIRTWLYNTNGNEVATLHSEPRGMLRLDVLGTTKVNTIRRAGVIPTLSWATEQAYALSNANGSVVWHGEVLRGKQEPIVTEIEVEFEGNLVAKTIRYPTYYGTSLFLNGTKVGRMAYHPKERELVFDFPGLTEGRFTPEVLKPVGGWKFTPTMAWMHVQALAFYQFHSTVKAKQVAQAQPNWFMKPERNWFQKAWEAVFPTVYAQDGCTGLHWMDQSIYRPCCDVHDYCFIKTGCDRYSWFWPFAGSWVCVPCNVFAVGCFFGVGTGSGYIWHPTP